MNQYLNILNEKKWLVPIIVGAFAFASILVITLNITLAFLSLIIFSSVGIFQRSFHYGLIFFLVVILIFPPANIITNIINTGELFLLILVLIGSVSFMLDRYKITILPLFYYWTILAIISSISFLLREDAFIFYETNQLAIKQILLTLIIYPIAITSFRYFFQTIRRLERLFLVISLVGSVQAVIGLLFLKGLFGFNQYYEIDITAWSTLLIVTIPITLGMWFTQISYLSTLKFLWFKQGRQNINKIVDVVLTGDKTIKHKSQKMIVNLKKTSINIQIAIASSFLLQVIALISSLSYLECISLGIGIFIIGVLMRDRRIIWVVLVAIVTLIILLPGLEPVLIVQLKQNILSLLSSIKNTDSINLLWQGTEFQHKQQVNGAYFFIFSKLGIAGLIIFVLGLAQYFKEIRKAYLRSDKFERIWLIIIFAIFVEFIFLGITSNVFFIWPTGLLFWLLYGILQNLKSRKKDYRLTETVLMSNN